MKKLALYVHDFRLEVGHSNSLIELIRHLSPQTLDKVEEIEVISHIAAPLKDLFPEFKGKLKWVKVPFTNVQPSLLKSLWFQAWTFFYNTLFQSKDFFRIGIGICCMDVHAVSVQFIHHQWTKNGLAMEKGFWLRKVYKKLLFAYYEICEDILFKRKGIKVFSPARFLTDFLKKKYPGIDATTIYSGVNLARFELNQLSKSEILADLETRYPSLKGLDVKKPIYIFVGAYERKGLYEALDLLAKESSSQFIVIGSPSLGRTIQWPSAVKVFPITFTREVAKFYSLADTFLFPTIYEPFGLVLFEAMAMGLTVITRRNEVGASELLEGLPEVYFSDSDKFSMPPISVKTVDDKKAIKEARLKKLGDVSWDKAGRELSVYLGDG